jgi:hypothetical protein
MSVFWNGKELVTESSRQPVSVPQEIANSFPNMQFVGVIWAGYQNLQKSLDTALGKESWNGVHIKVFDAPMEYQLSFADRWKLLNNCIPKDHAILDVIKPIPCTGPEQFNKFVSDVKNHNGAGVILRDPTSKYTKANSFFKIQVIYLYQT